MQKNAESEEAQSQKFMDAQRQISRGLNFANQLPPDADPHYAGNGVMLGSPNTPIFWYRPKDSKNYRVVYADLSVRQSDAPPSAARRPDAARSARSDRFEIIVRRRHQQDVPSRLARELAPGGRTVLSSILNFTLTASQEAYPTISAAVHAISLAFAGGSHGHEALVGRDDGYYAQPEFVAHFYRFARRDLAIADFQVQILFARLVELQYLARANLQDPAERLLLLRQCNHNWNPDSQQAPSVRRKLASAGLAGAIADRLPSGFGLKTGLDRNCCFRRRLRRRISRVHLGAFSAEFCAISAMYFISG